MIEIFDIQNIPAEKLGDVGGKARGLNSLIKFGFNVPDAFVVTGIEDNDSYDAVHDKYYSSGWSEVSVRSSATLEDGKDFSAAGQFSTFLNVSGCDNVVSSVKDCVSSLHNVTAEKYSKVFLRAADCRMTVIVQRMVNAKCAGVIFSRAPMRSGYVLVEAVRGLGENLVSGKVSAQQFRVRGNCIEKMPEDSILTEQQVIALGNAGKKAEKLFGKPMDLEWAIDFDGVIHWLQARPITIGESVTMNELDCDIDATKVVYTTGNIGEVMPGAVTPLTLSTNMYSLDWAVMKTYVDCGCFDKEQPPYHFIASYYNHMFFNMSSMYIIAHYVAGCSKETLDISLCGKVLTDLPDVDLPYKNIFVRLKNFIPFMKLVTGGERAKNGMKEVVGSLHFDLSLDKDALYQQILDNFKYMKMAHYHHYGASYYSGAASAMLHTILEKDYKDKDTLDSCIAGCLTEIEDFESANILRSMKSLAKLMIEDKPSIASASSLEIQSYFENEASEKVLASYNDFMTRHGYRGILENELMNLPWRDNPQSFCQSIKSVLASINVDNGRAEKSWLDYSEEILSKYKGAKRKLVYKNILKARKGVCYREFTKSKVIYVVDQFKQAYRRLAELMVECKMLPDASCIFFLTQDEIGHLLGGDQSLVKKALARKRLYPQQMPLRFPYAAMGVPQPLSAASSDPDVTSYQGTPVSRGVATGIARIVNNEDDAEKLQPGEIMIANCVDIGWSPYYSIIGGLVTEIGSALSHGVVVAREYALPTVVNVANAMDVIKTGDNITIDGNSGMVIVNR